MAGMTPLRPLFAPPPPLPDQPYGRPPALTVPPHQRPPRVATAGPPEAGQVPGTDLPGGDTQQPRPAGEELDMME